MSKKKKSSNFLVQGSILAIAGVIVRVIGLLYRVPMQNILGPTGAGLYNSAYSVYTILLLLSSYSLPIVISKMISSRITMGEYRNASNVMKTAVFLAGGIGITAGLICYFGAGPFARLLLKDENTIIAIRALSPCVVTMAFLGVFRGYFQGRGTMVPTAISQIVEQILNAVVSVVCAYYLYNSGLQTSEAQAQAYGAAGGTIGTTSGAIAALIFLILTFSVQLRSFRRKIRQDEHRREETWNVITKKIIQMALPVILSQTVYNISTIIDQSIYAYSVSGSYMSTWGIYSGIYLMMINVPIAIANAMASSAVPTLTSRVADKDVRGAIKDVKLAIRFTMIVALPSAVGLTVLASPIVNMLFTDGTELGSLMLLCGSCAVIFFSLSTLMNGILQGLNHMSTPVRNAVIALIFHVVILVFCLYVFKMDVFGVVFANMMFGLIMCILDAKCITDILGYRQEILKTFLLPGAASLLMGIVCTLVYKLFYVVTKINTLSTLIAILAAVLVYAVLLLLLRCINEEELYHFPMGARLVGIAKRTHLL